MWPIDLKKKPNPKDTKEIVWWGGTTRREENKEIGGGI
jgi:hypothetical protein